MPEQIESLPLFPLGLVLLPGEMQPLHVFEERYKAMVGDCLDRESEFGIVWLGDGGLREVGCTAEIAQVLDRMDDGRMNILTRGSRPLRLLRRVEDLPYPAGDVELLEDHPEEPDDDAEQAARIAYAALVERVTSERPQEEQLDELGSYGMAATISFDLDEKQELLELRSENARLERLASLCLRARERYDYAQRAADRAQTNGKVRR